MRRSVVSIGITLQVLQLSTVLGQCPEYFRYYRNETTKEIMGTVEIPSPPLGVPLELRVELSIPGIPPPEHTARIELAKSADDSIRSILQGSPLFYKIYFPPSKPEPLVTSILLNNVNYCSGPPAAGIIVTSISLQHSLHPPRAVIPLTPEQLSVYTSNRTAAPESSRFKPIVSSTTTKPHEPPTSQPSHHQPVHPPRRKLTDLSCGLVGENATGLPWPWLAAIFILNYNDEPEFLCTGSLISRQHVLTVAQCLIADEREIPPERLIVSLGRREESLNVTAAQINAHPDYANPSSGDSDLAIVKLTERVDFTQSVRSICLWLGELSLDSVVGSSNGMLVGYEACEFTLKPRASKVKIVSQEDCLRRNPAFFEVTSNRTFCAEFKDESGFCNGATGSGLAMLHRTYNRYHLRGVLSLLMYDPKTRFCDLDEYVVYVDVAKYLVWIRQTITNSAGSKTRKKAPNESPAAVEPKPDDYSCGLASKLDDSLPWPWIAAVFVLDHEGKPEFRCNGNLLSRQHVLTVARCLIEDDEEIPANRLLILLGKLDVANKGNSAYVEAAQIRLHPDFMNLDNADSDLAVVKLRQPVNFTASIRSVCLWMGDLDLDSAIASPGSFVAGWKRKDDLVAPRSFKVTIVTQEKCLHSNSRYRELTSNQTFCAANENFQNDDDICGGGIGSGLAFLHPRYKRYHLRGIMSVFLQNERTRSCNAHEYVVYVDVAKYLTWIKQTIL